MDSSFNDFWAKIGFLAKSKTVKNGLKCYKSNFNWGCYLIIIFKVKLVSNGVLELDFSYDNCFLCMIFKIRTFEKK
jgi:hypothetical protein